ncbi:MAG: hypothetical protein ACOX6L_01560 [Syntrophomonadaceae bacterium]
MERGKNIIVTTDASGARQAVRENLVVMIVDVIDMSTTLESALDAGAYAVLGCSPDFSRAPVPLDPHKIGQEAARLARETGQGIVLVTEPRIGTDKERIARCQKLLTSLEREKISIDAVVPNLGAETPKLVDMKNRVIVAVTDTGGVAYDAAFNEGGAVFTGTVARTLAMRGIEPARQAVKRAIKFSREYNRGIAIVAASRNSMEDFLAAQFIANLLISSQGEEE